MFRDHRHAFVRHAIAHDTTGLNGVNPFKAADERLVRDVWAVLQQHYPGHPWHVTASHRAGMAQIFLPTFSTWSFNIRLSDLKADPHMGLVIKGAGEMLERWRLPRAGFDVSHYVAAQKRFQPQFHINRRPPD